jgi:hypothetical protein
MRRFHEELLLACFTHMRMWRSCRSGKVNRVNRIIGAVFSIRRILNPFARLARLILIPDQSISSYLWTILLIDLEGPIDRFPDWDHGWQSVEPNPRFDQRYSVPGRIDLSSCTMLQINKCEVTGCMQFTILSPTATRYKNARTIGASIQPRSNHDAITSGSRFANSISSCLVLMGRQIFNLGEIRTFRKPIGNVRAQCRPFITICV